MLSDESENEEMKQELKSQLVSAVTKDLSASDCLVALFWSALTNYRHDTVLRPFPQMFLLKDGNKDVDGMRALFKDIPSLNKIHQQPDSINKTILKLLHWIICTKSFTLSSKLASEFSIIESKTPGSSHSTKPYCFFELNYAIELEEKWNKLVGDYGTFLAYHGSRVENFHCITHIGLLSHMNKTGVFGEGTYLSTDLGVCMNFSPSANTWPKSSLPPLCSMVAVCEVINHPEIRSRVQVGGEPTLNQKIPERYFVVTNDELIRLKYILVFAHERSRPRSTQRWLVNHKWTVIVICYVLLLVFLGLWQSRYFSKLYYQYSRKYISL